MDSHVSATASVIVDSRWATTHRNLIAFELGEPEPGAAEIGDRVRVAIAKS
jgi:hypothetical protein